MDQSPSLTRSTLAAGFLRGFRGPGRSSCALFSVGATAGSAQHLPGHDKVLHCTDSLKWPGC